MSKIGLSKSPAAYVSTLSKALDGGGAGKAEKSNKQKNSGRTGAENAGEQVSLVSPLKRAHQKNEKLRVFSKVRLALDKDISKAKKHARTPTAELEKVIPVNGLKNARTKPLSLKSKSAWGKFRNFLRKNESPTSGSSGLASEGSPQSTPLKKIRFGNDTEASYVVGTPPASGSAGHPQSEVRKTVNVSESFDISALRKLDDIDSYLDKWDKKSAEEKPSGDDDTDELRLHLKQEEDELDKILPEYKSGAPAMPKAEQPLEALKAPAHEREDHLENGKKLAPDTASQDSNGHTFRRMHEELKALGQEIEQDLEGWIALSSQPASEKSVERKPGTMDDSDLQAEQKIARDLRIARNYETIDRLIAEAEENLRADRAEKSEISRPGAADK